MFYALLLRNIRYSTRIKAIHCSNVVWSRHTADQIT